ncbi:MAG TPA: hypothetical protein VL308_01775 [Gemmatimonadaceae bacterium]|jgi:hypothetical protein|nr:hypothetical protein [Gemmatimonadaceae bacterium]
MRVLHVEQDGSGERCLGTGKLATFEKQFTERGVVLRLTTIVECRLSELCFGLVVQANLVRFVPIPVGARRTTSGLRRTRSPTPAA